MASDAAAEFVRRYVGKVVLITHPLCSGCREYEERLKEEIDRGEVVKVDVTKDESAKALMDVLSETIGLDSLPAVLVVEKEGGKLMVCDAESQKCVEVYEPED